MKYYPSNINQVITKITLKQISSILLYGPDRGMISDIVSQLTKKLNARIATANNYTDLSSSLNNTSMFNQKEIIKISSELKLHEDAKSLLQKYHSNFPLIIAEDLAPANALRKFYEGSESLAAVACYPDDENAIRRMISQKCAYYNQQITTRAISFLSSSLGGDRLMILSELEKLFLYMRNVHTIDVADCEKIISKSSNHNADNLCIAYGVLDAQEYLREQDALLTNSISEIWIIRALGRYYLNILKVKLYIEDGLSVASSMNLLKPSIFFKYAEGFKKSVAQNSIRAISKSLDLFIKAEIDAKNGLGHQALELIFIERFLRK